MRNKRKLARDELRRVVAFCVAEKIGKLDQLGESGSITEGEFARLRAIAEVFPWRHRGGDFAL